MKHSKFEEIIEQYEFANKGGNVHSLFKRHSEWFKKSTEDGSLKSSLEETLQEVNQTKNLRKYDFVILIIQAVNINFTEEDIHFELLFSIANSITKNFTFSLQKDKLSYLLHQLTDICIHHYDAIELVKKRKPKLISNIVRKIGEIKYESTKDSSDIYLATQKAVGLIWHLPNKDAKKLIKEIYLKHFDERIIEEAKELIEQLKEDGRYY